MLVQSRLTLDSVPLFMTAIALAAVWVIAMTWKRSVSVRSASFWFIAVGLLVIAYAAGGARWVGRDAGKVAVMVDVSASTRGATFHDEAVLRQRIEVLLAPGSYGLLRFGDGADRTTWTPPAPDASAVLLFSDGRFEPPATAPPVYAVIDPALEHRADAAVTSLERRGEQIVVNTFKGGEGPRELAVNGTTSVVQGGAGTVTLAATDVATVAELSIGDAWPENDMLTLLNPPPALSERWWVGGDSAPAGWRSLAPTDLPTEAAAWLAPSVVVLDNVSAEAISPAQVQRIEQYVRDLGGGLLILGGDDAFASGGYDGSPLGALSPLASTPPRPAAHWTFLIDASGSMAGEAPSGGGTRLNAAVAAARGAVAQLPPSDLLSIAGFSDELRWWSRGKPVKEFALAAIPPARGPTNLDAALRSLAPSLDASVSNHAVLLTDGQVELPAADATAASLKATRAQLHVFAIGTGPGLPLLRKLAEATGGTFTEQPDAQAWAGGMVKLLRQVSPKYWNTTPVQVRFANLPAATTSAWNRTWLKVGAEELARTTDEPSISMAARMNVGSGNVAAVAFRPADGHVEPLASLVQTPPRDPRLKVTWRTGRELVVDIDAATDAAPINGLSPTLVLSSPAGAGETLPVPQTGPGRYALTLPSPTLPKLATVRIDGRTVDRFAVAGRYAPEFDGIGNDRAALSSLARRSGGRVIEPSERARLSIRTGRRGTDLAPPLATAGAVLVGLGLIAWRSKR